MDLICDNNVESLKRKVFEFAKDNKFGIRVAKSAKKGMQMYLVKFECCCAGKDFIYFVF